MRLTARYIYPSGMIYGCKAEAGIPKPEARELQ
jgi:hypothetical protein